MNIYIYIYIYRVDLAMNHECVAVCCSELQCESYVRVVFDIYIRHIQICMCHTYSCQVYVSFIYVCMRKCAHMDAEVQTRKNLFMGKVSKVSKVSKWCRSGCAQ